MFGIHIDKIYIPENVVQLIIIQRNTIKIKLLTIQDSKLINYLDQRLLSQKNIISLRINQIPIQGSFAFSKRTLRGVGGNSKFGTYLTLIRIDNQLRYIEPPILRRKRTRKKSYQKH